MKTLYLLRHAKSSREDQALDDFDRPLTARGKRACAVLRAALHQLGIEPEVVLCSAARRAEETLQRIAAGLPKECSIIQEKRLYQAGAKRLLTRLRKLDATVGSAMLIGHNPGLHRLALFLVGAGEPALLERLKAKLPTAGVAELRLQAGGWDDLGSGTCTLLRLWAPRDSEGDKALTRARTSRRV